MSSSVVVRAAIVAAWVVVGCSDGDGQGGGSIGIDDGAGNGESASVEVLPSKVATLKLSTGASVTIPEGSLTSALRVTLERPSNRVAASLVRSMRADFQLSSAPYVVSPHRQSFSKDVTVTLPVARGQASRLVVAWLEDENDQNWKILGRPEVASARASVSVDHFSVLALFEEPEGDFLDAGVPGEMDAATDDASLRPDASTADAAVLPQTLTERVKAKLVECSLVAREGDFQLQFHGTADSIDGRCRRECVSALTCLELQNELCGLGFNSPAFARCYESCTGHKENLSCLDVSGSAVQATACDGEVTCANGEDEQACPANAFFTCVSDGAKIAESQRCNGVVSCNDGSDEASCPVDSYFPCSGGSIISPFWVCDGEPDCDGGEDELSCAGKLHTCDTDEVHNVRDVCNGYYDCADRTDEPMRCLQVYCTTVGTEEPAR